MCFFFYLTLDSYFVLVVGERLLPTNVAWVRFRRGAICGLSLVLFALLRAGFSSGFPVASLYKNQHLQIPIRPEERTRIKTR